jgi:general stress protein 26
MRARLLLIVTLALAGSGATTALSQTTAGPSRDTLIGAARAIMNAARYCAVMTLDASGRVQARAIDAFPPEPDMTVWFATNPASRKVEEIRRDPRVTLYYFDARAPEEGYVTLLGRARLVDDPAEKRRRWKDGWEAFWPDRNAGYLLVEVTPDRLEIVSPRRGIEGDRRTWRPPVLEFPRKP